MSRVGETGVGEMGIGETGVGEMGVGETGPNRACQSASYRAEFQSLIGYVRVMTSKGCGRRELLCEGIRCLVNLKMIKRPQ